MPIKSGLYTAGRVPAVSCKLPNKLVRTRAGLLAYAKLMVGCMQRAWTPLVARAGFYLPDAADRRLRRRQDDGHPAV